jgi:hypothetical protein
MSGDLPREVAGPPGPSPAGGYGPWPLPFQALVSTGGLGCTLTPVEPDR